MEIVKRLLEIGIHDNISSVEEKKIRLMNGICIIWSLSLMVYIVLDLIELKHPLNNILTHSFSISIICIVVVLQHFRKYYLAKLTVFILISVSSCVFAYFLEPGNLMEYFLIFLAPSGLLLTDDKKLCIILLFIAMLLFFVPNFILFPESPILKSAFTKVGIFVVMYVIINYFKSLNNKNEQLLKEQKNEAIKDKEIIDQKNNELTNLYEAQNQTFINLAHEIRTPLTLIKGYQAMLLEQQKTIESLEIAQVLEQQTNKINHLVSDILDLSKMDSNQFSLNFSYVNITHFLRDIYSSFLSSFEQRSIEFIYEDKTKGDIMVSADLVYLERVIQNLLSNAQKYCKENDKVKLSLEETEFEIRIKVSDTGMGIKDENQEKVFERFYQENNDVNNAGGSGIGLAYCKEIIQRHKGEISVSSNWGIGSVFEVCLKKEYGKSISKPVPIVPFVDTEIKAIEETNDKSSKLMIIDDDTQMRTYLRSIFDAYTVLEAKDGQEALNVLQMNKVDCVITDYMMPTMNGYEFVEKFKQINEFTPVIVLTAKSDSVEKISLMKLGVDDYVLKPFEAEELKVRVSNSILNSKRRSSFIDSDENIVDVKEDFQDPFLNRLAQYIEENCTQTGFSATDVCDEFALSNSSLYRRIKLKSGMSIKEFFIEVRLQKARRLYEKNRNLKAKTLAVEIGFSNVYYFQNIFKDRFGVDLK